MNYSPPTKPRLASGAISPVQGPPYGLHPGTPVSGTLRGAAQ